MDSSFNESSHNLKHDLILENSNPSYNVDDEKNVLFSQVNVKGFDKYSELLEDEINALDNLVENIQDPRIEKYDQLLQTHKGLQKGNEELRKNYETLQKNHEELQKVHGVLQNDHKELQDKFQSCKNEKAQIANQLKQLKKLETINTKTIDNYKKNADYYENYVDELKKANVDLKEQASKYQSALGIAKTFRLGDEDKNNSVQLRDDILSLQNALEIYITNLRPNISIDIKMVNTLFTKYQSKIKLKTKDNAFSSIKAVLQRHVLETIFGYIKTYFDRTSSIFERVSFFNRKDDYYLEAQFVNKAKELDKLANEFASTRDGTDNVTSAVPIKIRQQIYAALGTRGFSDIVIDENKPNEHNFINLHKEKLNKEMDSYRKINDPAKEKEIKNKTADIIREVVRIFFFRLKTQEPIAEYEWISPNEEFDSNRMTESSHEDDIENAYVDLCIFPLIYKKSNYSSNLQVYTPAKVLIHYKQ
ncbi:14420_t:CDS:1 [Funneliformis mosseae]|uniref:14420_t:CDS:1 n=1 Tax=Funneliformis mosseae TaxID=27381 RepID=A0A9N8WFK3_FUNMO|nr:14420_t:CDS:1 [Funneliformis mosseae]